MSQNKKYFIKCDSETTGIDSNTDQMLTFAYMVKDETDTVIEKKEYKIKLKSGVIPSPMALLTNKINPFSKEYVKNAITEKQFVDDFESVLKKYAVKDPTGKVRLPQFESYNVPFDKSFASIAFARSGKKLNDVMSRSSIDPLKTVRKLIKNYESYLEDKSKDQNNPPKYKEFVEKLRKPEKSLGRTFRGSDFSAKLEDVARALDIKYGGSGAHSAMADTEVLDKVGNQVFKLATGLERKDVSTDPSSFEVGKVYSIISDSASSGVKTRHIRVIKNDFDKGQLVVLDEDDIKKNGELKDSAVRTFNYDTVIGESKLDQGSAISLDAYYNTQKDTIDNWADAAASKGRKADDIFDEDTRHFGLIKAVSDRMTRATDKMAEFDKCYNEMIEKFNGDKISAKTVMTKAERLAEAEGFENWSEKLFPNKKISVLEKKVGDTTLRVALQPSGLYKFFLDYTANGEKFNNIDEAKGKPELKKLLKERLGSIADFEEFIKDLPTGSDFADPKNSQALANDLKKALEQLKNNPDPAASEALSALIMHLKERDPETFKTFKPLVEADYSKMEAATPEQKPEEEQVGLHENMKALNVMPEMQATAVESDHMPKGQKAGKSPCSLCGRPLSAAISREFAMGPTCREKAEALDLSNEPIENFVSEMKPAAQVKKAIAPGEISAIKIKRHDGTEPVIYSTVLSVSEDSIKILDRRACEKAIKAGQDREMSVYSNMKKIMKSDIIAVGKIDSEKVTTKKAA